MITKYILLLSALIAIIFASAASIIPLGTFNQAEVSAMLPTLITPATFTFSIWSVIYLSWIALGVLVVFKKIDITKENTYLLAAAQILSSIWLIPSQYLWIGSSFIVMAGVFYLLSMLFFNSRKESPVFRYIVDLFLGWILIAFLANMHLMLVSYNLYVFPLFLTIDSILAGLIINIYLIVKHSSYIPSAVLVWALIWIIIWQENTITQTVSFLSLLTIVLVAGQKMYREKK